MRLIDADAITEDERQEHGFFYDSDLQELLDEQPTIDISNTSNTLGALDCVERLINASDLIDWIMESCPDWCVGDVRGIVDHIHEMPSAQPQKGKWIYGEHDVAMCDGYRCDKCGFFVSWDYQHKFIDFIKDYIYCPSCGADMEVKND